MQPATSHDSDSGLTTGCSTGTTTSSAWLIRPAEDGITHRETLDVLTH